MQKKEEKIKTKAAVTVSHMSSAGNSSTMSTLEKKKYQSCFNTATDNMRKMLSAVMKGLMVSGTQFLSRVTGHKYM